MKESPEQEQEQLSLRLQLRLPLRKRKRKKRGREAFELEEAVCSHGLFMMAPNRWDPLSRTFHRPLRLSSSPSTSLPVAISHSHSSDSALDIRVSGTDSLSPQDQEAILNQVKRMLRISPGNDRLVREFHQLHQAAKEKGFARIFRSPTLFEDMVKCILLCNCTWPRTLAMVKDLCALQLDLKAANAISPQGFKPNTPQTKEPQRKYAKPKVKSQTVLKLETKFAGSKQEPMGNGSTSKADDDDDEIEIGDFPTADELAPLDTEYLAARCKLGYRAQRIVSLAQGVVGGDVQVKELEELCNDGDAFYMYDTLYSKLQDIPGFGPFTCANVLMCMGYFHKIPIDSETLRHFKAFHKIDCTMSTIKEKIVAIYGKYAPFQFLAYWFELWDYYEETFGNTRDMAPSDYRLITATNMKTREPKKRKK